MKKRIHLIILSFVLLCSSGLLAQSTGKIMGKVTDATGEPIPSANVIVEGTALGAASDFEGNYVILNVPPGLHNITSSFIGYQKTTITGVRVNVGFTTTLNIQLTSGEVTMGTIVVQGERNPLIRQDLTNPTVAITSESLDILPVDNVVDVIKLQAGVVTGDDGSIHIRGGYGNEVAYSLNGLSMNDPYGNSRSVGVATNAVQEVSVSTGTFSAEFGNALSGVVNYVTKEGGDKYSVSVRGYSGDYVSNRKQLFSNVDDVDPLNHARTEFTLGGPIPFSPNTHFFVSGIYEKFKGSYYGQRLYNPTDSYLTPDQFRNNDPRSGKATGAYYFNPFSRNSNGLPTGDSAYVAMNPSENWNFQGNISHRFSPTVKLRYEIVYEKGKSKGFSVDGGRSYLFNPDGNGYDYSFGNVHSLDLTHTVSDMTFYTIKGSYSYNKGEHYLYEDRNDPRYVPSFYRKVIGNTTYYAGGTDNYRSKRSTETTTLKGDIVSQMFGSHEVKLGFELRQHKINRFGESLEFFKLKNIGGTLVPTVVDVTDMLYNDTLQIVRGSLIDVSSYEKKPFQASAYVQDKIELAQTLILNVGLRYEMFAPNSKYNAEISKDITESQSGYLVHYLKDAEIKHMISPRFSVSYPITDRGVIRFSYGHFYQVGSLSELYQNDRLWVANISSIPDFGNPNVKPQKSVQYEIGLQQQLTEDFKFDLTGYYKDVRDYIFTQTVYTQAARQYQILTNLAYSNVKGITLSFMKRRAQDGLFSATLDYTFQIAEGNRTQPEEDLFFSEASGKQTETFLVPLSFDRAHLINGTLTLSDPQSWSIGFIYNIQTGTPYTPALPPSLSTITYEQSSSTKPLNWNVDLKMEKFFKIGALNYSVFLQVENLFDTENERYVYASSGRALSNVEQQLQANQFNDIRQRIARGDKGMIDSSVLDNYYSARPERVSRPREVRLGFSILFN